MIVTCVATAMHVFLCINATCNRLIISAVARFFVSCNERNVLILNELQRIY